MPTPAICNALNPPVVKEQLVQEQFRCPRWSGPHRPATTPSERQSERQLFLICHGLFRSRRSSNRSNQVSAVDSTICGRGRNKKSNQRSTNPSSVEKNAG